MYRIAILVLLCLANTAHAVAPVNTLPSSPTVNEDDINVAIADDINIADSDGDNQAVTLTMTGGTASISTSGLSFTTGDGADDGLMAFSGTLASINTALDAMTFTPTTNLNGVSAGSIQIQTDDGNSGTDDDTIQFNIVAVNDDPTETGIFPTDITIIEDTAGDFDLSDLTLADIDAAASNVVMTLTASAGTLTASNGGSVTISGSASGTMTLTGSIANIDTYINIASNIKYTGSENINGNDAATVAIKINDGGNTGSGGGGDVALGTVNMDITAVNDDPSISGLASDVTVTEETASDLDLSASAFADVDSAGDVIVTLTAGSGTMAASNSGGVVIGGSGTGSLTLTGTVTEINTFLNTASNVQYTGATDVTGNDATTVTVTANDGDGSGNIALGTVNIDITGVNDGPSISGLASDVTVIEETASDLDLSASAFADVDSAGDVIVTLTAGSGTMAASNSGGVVIGGSGTGSLTLTGTVTEINTFLNTASNVQYTGATDVTGNDATTVTVTANDGDGSGNIALGTVNIDITGVNDIPTDIGLSAVSINQSATGAGADVGTLSSTDVDDASFTYSLVSTGVSDGGTCGAGNDADNGSFQINASLLETQAVTTAGTYQICLQTSDGSNSYQKAFTMTINDNVGPTVSSVTIPDSAHKVGDVVTATISVPSDSDDYTTGSGGISGTLNGYALGSLSKTNDTSYRATFTITDGGGDVAAGSNITLSFTLNDSSGNTGAIYTTTISQASDAIYANLPDITLSVDTNTLAEDGGISTLSGNINNTLNNQWPSGIIVNLAYTGTATVGTDYTKSNSLTINANSTSGTTTVTSTADTHYDAASDETVIVDISSVSVGTESGSQQQTLSITDAESAPTVTLSVSSAVVTENGGSAAITASLSHPTYENVTVSVGYSGTATSGTDYVIPSSSFTLMGGSTSVNAVTGITGINDELIEGSETIVIDIITVTGGGATENAIQQQTITLSDDDNATPVITSTAITTIAEDVLYKYTVAATDSDSGDILTFSAPTLPEWLGFTPATGLLTGTPSNEHVGSHTVKLRVNDGNVTVDQDFTIIVSNTNDAPTITGTPLTTGVEGMVYSFSVSAADVDTGDSISYQIANQPAWLAINSSGLVSGTPGNSDIGSTSNIIVSVTDGVLSTSLPAFTITVDSDLDGDGTGDTSDTDIDGDGMSNAFENTHGLDPLDATDASGDLDGDGVSNLDEFINNSNPELDDYGPVIRLDSFVTIDAVALLTSLPGNLATASDGLDGDVVITHDLEKTFLAPGRYEINWSAIDSTDNESTASQTLNVRPLANWQVDQNSGEDNTVSVTLYLNGEAPEYPVVANYTVSGSASNPDDHDATSGSFSITEGQSASVDVAVVGDLVSETDETILFTLNSITNAVIGVQIDHQITISEFNHSPTLALEAVLDSAPTTPVRLLATSDGAVTIKATVTDVDPSDTHSFEWTDSHNLNGTALGSTYTFNPETSGAGVYQLTVTTTDDAASPESGTAVITLTILDRAPTLSIAIDSDGDGIDDSTEGLGDSDGDSVPDFADSTDEVNLLAMFPTGGEPVEGAWFMEAQPGLSLQLNVYSSGSGDFSPLLATDDVVDANQEDQSDAGFVYDGGLFDFVVSNMPVPGETVFVIMPQLNPIPENAVYRKEVNGEWFDYVEDGNNFISSAPGELGVCPPPGSIEYLPGLTEGDYCVQLGIEDGGVNDADGAAGGTILDPGGVALAVVIPETVSSSGGGAITWPFWLLLALGTILRMNKFRADSSLTQPKEKGE